MANMQSIIAGIIQRVNASREPNVRTWRIGITHDVNKRFEEWGKPQHFLYWQADSLSVAQAVESHFINHGMQGGTGGDMSPWKNTFVYIF